MLAPADLGAATCPFFWGKLSHSSSDPSAPLHFHPLIDHCADVAASMERLLASSVIRSRLVCLGHTRALDDVQCARLCVITALHDIGKFNHGFQAKAIQGTEIRQAGHVQEALAMLTSGESARLLQGRLPLDEWTAWADASCGIDPYIIAAICHHGRPHRLDHAFEARLWTNDGHRDPFLGIAALVDRCRTWFPKAFLKGGDPLPASTNLHHAFGGLVMLADWIGSDNSVFSYGEHGGPDRIGFARAHASILFKEFGLDPTEARAALGHAPVPFQRIYPFPARPLQAAIMDVPCDPSGATTVLEAETGSGKTEAAVMRFVRLFQANLVDGMYFALPTRTAATQIFDRVKMAIGQAFPDRDRRPPVVLAVPGYIVVDDSRGRRLADFKVLWDDDPTSRWRFRGWAAENPKRYLAGAIVVGTIDQVLLSTLQVGHAHLRSAALLRHLLVVDEVHASDHYMTSLLERVLERHRRAGGHALLMSATLGAAARCRLLAGADSLTPTPAEARDTPYPLITHLPHGGASTSIRIGGHANPKKITIEMAALCEDPQAIAHRALAAATAGASVLIIRNTVRDCVATQVALETQAERGGKRHALFTCAGVAAPHHARFSAPDRAVLDQAIQERFGSPGPREPCIAVATQTVQQSLDLDADVLISDLCPMDTLLQRIGRLHRRPARVRPLGFMAARCLVLTPASRDLSVLLDSQGKARGRHGFGTVYADLRIVEATWRQCEAHDTWNLPEMNRALVEAATHPHVLDALAREMAEKWSRHRTAMLGKAFAEFALASTNAVDWGQPYGEMHFPGTLEGLIQTRLGEGDRLVEFLTPFASPFGTHVSTLTIPARMARDVPADLGPVSAKTTGRETEFQLGSSRFRYDQHGLRPIGDQ